MNTDNETTAVESAAQKTTLAAALATDISLRRNQALQDRIDQRSSTNPPARTYSYLSSVEECDRQMVYAVTHPGERAKIDTDLKARFEAGELQENQIIIELRQLGYDVVLQQESVVIPDRQGNTIGRGKVDGHILFNKIKVPIEIKSMHPRIFDGVDGLDDFKKKPHLRRYLRQMAMYLYGNNVEEGLFIITDCLGHWKIIVVTLDYAEGEQILQRLERVHKALKENTLPDRIEYRDDVCGKCYFAQICLPDVIRQESAIITDDELIQRIERWNKIKPVAAEYKDLDKSVKADLKRRVEKRGLAGDFVINISTSNVKEKIIPAGTQTRVSIEKLSGMGTQGQL